MVIGSSAIYTSGFITDGKMIDSSDTHSIGLI